MHGTKNNLKGAYDKICSSITNRRKHVLLSFKKVPQRNAFQSIAAALWNQHVVYLVSDNVAEDAQIAELLPLCLEALHSDCFYYMSYLLVVYTSTAFVIAVPLLHVVLLSSILFGLFPSSHMQNWH